MNNPEEGSSYYHQQQDSTTAPLDPLHHSYSQQQHESSEESSEIAPAWSFTDTHKTRLLSRDGSSHVTDEVFNSVSHLSAAMISLLGMVLLIVQSEGNAWKIVSFSLYGASLIFLFVCSTLHHAINSSTEVEAKLRMLDYLAIYPLIAGTFTPFCLVFLHNSVIGWSFFGVAWFLALMGMYLTARFGPERIPKWMSMTMYITIGWFGGILAFWLLPEIGVGGLEVFFLGGVAYTVGGVVYTTERPNPIPGKFGFHEIWHVAVVLGAAIHYCVMYFYVLPWGL
mmetsp:Transcript_5369/g.12201  ORF Transcript_5369/g.12201 Transcript_5369/m.12201 type:complete len:282 (-) Transcript_5369:265-1110(-)|eukprot:CAMPEP_0172317978 /NCGR_PEP_ID=MMETSP1058-20130122/33494_1 /TAXON_ID=83371 /ORGANISM="Detonula confervacea, Strain CCMP 353" /LENGTH=281 /DNA_ID=CAMNT_0013032681 /DNA_START=104 /DNA_END=949 /DNA_ORIENTATION=+